MARQKSARISISPEETAKLLTPDRDRMVQVVDKGGNDLFLMRAQVVCALARAGVVKGESRGQYVLWVVLLCSVHHARAVERQYLRPLPERGQISRKKQDPGAPLWVQRADRSRRGAGSFTAIRTQVQSHTESAERLRSVAAIRESSA